MTCIRWKSCGRSSRRRNPVRLLVSGEECSGQPWISRLPDCLPECFPTLRHGLTSIVSKPQTHSCLDKPKPCGPSAVCCGGGAARRPGGRGVMRNERCVKTQLINTRSKTRVQTQLKICRDAHVSGRRVQTEEEPDLEVLTNQSELPSGAVVVLCSQRP